MKSNIVTRLIIDSENSKVYLSVEGNVEKATTDERESLRDNLVKAFSEVLGLGTAFTKKEAGLLSDFVPAEEAPPSIVTQLALSEEIPEILSDKGSATVEKEKIVEVVIEPVAETVAPKTVVSVASTEPTLLFGKYKGMTPSDAIAKEEGGAVRYFLDFMLPKALMKDEERNKETIEAINQAIAVFKNGGPILDAQVIIDEIAAICKKYDDAELSTPKMIAQSIGTSYATAVSTKDTASLSKILGMVKQIIAKHENATQE